VTSHRLTIILVHVDNCIIAAISIVLVDWVKDGVKEFVEITDFGEIQWLLSI